MLLPSQSLEAIPEQTKLVVEAIFPNGTPLLQIRQQLGAIYQDQTFTPLFSKRGQPAEAPWRLALITVLQFVENLTDLQAAHAVRTRLDWKYLLGLELTDQGFHFSILSKFRARLIEGQAEKELLDQLLEALRQKELLNAGGQQRTDSTHVLAAVRGLTRLESVGEVLRALLNEVAVVAPQWLKSQVTPEWFDRYAHRFETYRLPKEETERVALAEIIGGDGLGLLRAIYGEHSPVYLKHLPMVEMARKVWLQQYWLDDGRIRQRELKDTPPASLRSESPYDPQAQYGSKRNTGWTGYKVHLTETCEEQGLHLITQVQTTFATVNDVSMTAPIHQALHEKQLLPKEHFVDAGYVDADLLVKSKAEYEVELLGPVRLDASWQAKAANGFDISNFKIDWPAHKVTCPNGKTNSSWSPLRDKWGNDAIRIKFSRTDCGKCAMRSLCTKSATEARHMGLRPQADHEALQRMRQAQTTSQWKLRYQRRAGVEGTISQGVRLGGLQRSRYVGLAKTRLQHLATAAAINLMRLVAWWEGRPLASTRISRFAALAA
jgi:transposase